MQPICVICHSTSAFLLNKDGYDLYRCEKCQLVFVYPMPTADFLSKEVYSEESGYQAHKKSDFSKLVQDEKTQRIFSTLGEGRGRKLLDVGCSSGEFMYWAQKGGFKPSGVELNPRTAAIARQNGFTVTVGTLDALPVPVGLFDVIFLGDVIEHVTDPRKLVSDCKKWLPNGGVLVISTPNLDCVWVKMTLLFYRWFRIPPSTLTPPFHLFQFSKNNLDQLLVGEGFSVGSEFFLKPPRLVYELGMLHLRKRFKQKKTIGTLAYMLFAYTLYTLAYGVNKIIVLVVQKDFSMVSIYHKKNA